MGQSDRFKPILSLACDTGVVVGPSLTQLGSGSPERSPSAGARSSARVSRGAHNPPPRWVRTPPSLPLEVCVCVCIRRDHVVVHARRMYTHTDTGTALSQSPVAPPLPPPPPRPPPRRHLKTPAIAKERQPPRRQEPMNPYPNLRRTTTRARRRSETASSSPVRPLPTAPGVTPRRRVQGGGAGGPPVGRLGPVLAQSFAVLCIVGWLAALVVVCCSSWAPWLQAMPSAPASLTPPSPPTPLRHCCCCRDC